MFFKTFKHSFGLFLQCPEMTKLLEPDVNLDAICKSEILDDMLILPQVAFDEASKISNPGMPNAVVTPVINNTPEKTPAKTRKTRSRSEFLSTHATSLTERCHVLSHLLCFRSSV